MGAALILLAGGKSSRFGRDKTLLRWDDQLVVERIIRLAAPLFREVLLVSNHPGKFALEGVEELCDLYPEMGPLGGIHAGLTAARCDTVFVTACDMPFFHRALARQLLDHAPRYEAALPRDGEAVEPLFAMLRRGPALAEAERMLSQGRRRMRDLYQRLDTCYLDREDWLGQAPEGDRDLFFNINHPEDYLRLTAGGASM